METNSKFDLLVRAFRTQFNAHFVFNSLNIVQHFITAGDKEAALSSLKQFSQLIRHYIRHYGQERTLVEEEVAMLHAYLFLQEKRYGDKIRIRKDFSGVQLVNERTIPSMLMALVLEGVIENLLQTGRSNLQVFVYTEVHEDEMTLFVQSNMVPWTGSSPESAVAYRKDMPDWKAQIDSLGAKADSPVRYVEIIGSEGLEPFSYRMELSLNLL